MYLQSLRKLDACSAAMVQPQKRRDIKGAMEACMGRLLEVRNWMVRLTRPPPKSGRQRDHWPCHNLLITLGKLQVYLNQGIDLINVEAAMKALDLTPDDLEIPIPRFYLEERAEACRLSLQLLCKILVCINRWEGALSP